MLIFFAGIKSNILYLVMIWLPLGRHCAESFLHCTSNHFSFNSNITSHLFIEMDFSVCFLFRRPALLPNTPMIIQTAPAR